LKVALDTNILAYAEGVNGESRKSAATALIREVPADNVMLPVQTLGELFNVLVRKAGRSRAAAHTAVLGWLDTFPVIDTSSQVLTEAAALASDRQLGLWDAIIIAASAHAGCRLLLSEDLQDGFTWSGLTVTNPFSASAHPLLIALRNARSES
jgi:predicted nucleic acid-binding protein